MKELFKQIIKDFHLKKFKGVKKREVNIPLKSEQIIALIGPRRSGKTYLMYYLITQIEDITNVIYIDFEDERLGYNWEFQEIIDAYLELYPTKDLSNVYFFFDEIQETNNWEKFVRRIHSSLSKNIFITGSSSKMLSKEISTSLRGRALSYEILPLSFKEYLSFKDIEIDIISTQGRANILNSLNKYIETGGFPGVIVNEDDENIREAMLKSYMNTMMFRDIVERYSISNSNVLRRFINILYNNLSNEISINRIYNDMNSNGLSVSKDSLYNYMDYIEDVFMGFRLNKIDGGYNSKFYSIDLGFNSIMSLKLSKDIGRMIENLVFLHLKRLGYDIFYDKNGFECDFIIKKNNVVVNAIQVCYELNENDIDREIKGIKKVKERFDLKKGLIINFSQDFSRDDIDIIPLFKFLLEFK
ncbi:MAG: ATP-binding protein [Candidatus Nanoarchaeia archaeon]|nr:ATP-binding protein [Candidatus Nanoarchaeia archaeon]